MIAGHLGADPEVRFTSGGQKVTTLRVATNSRKAGKEETIWWRVTVWGDQFDKLMPYFKKGSSIMVTGEMHKPEIFQDREGKSQISMNMTAYHLSFSPFGRASGGTEGGGQTQFSSNQGFSQNTAPMQPKKRKEETSFGSGGFDQENSGGGGFYNEDMYGQNQYQDNFSDEEIPF